MIMTVKDLIEDLSELPEDAHVVIPVDDSLEHVRGIQIRTYYNMDTALCIIFSESQVNCSNV